MRREAGAGPELYQRASLSVRVSRDVAGEPRPAVTLEEGSALRWHGPGGERIVAGTGGDVDAVRRLVAAVETGDDVSLDDDEVQRFDLEPGGDVDGEELTAWLESAVEGQGWIESATTVECWVGPGPGRFGQRTRRRTWAMSAGVGGERRWAATRGAALPDAGSFVPVRRPAAPAGDVTALVLSPDAAARLVPHLVQALHSEPGHLGRPTGAGWSVVDDPHDPRSLFGGTFDDGLDPTQPVRLAEAGRIVAALPVRGMARRASFRDLPVRIPSSLRVDGPPSLPPAGALWVDALVVHRPGPDRWILELPAGTLRFATTRPETLVQGISGTVGATFHGHRGVATPGLVVDGAAFRIE